MVDIGVQCNLKWETNYCFYVDIVLDFFFVSWRFVYTYGVLQCKAFKADGCESVKKNISVKWTERRVWFDKAGTLVWLHTCVCVIVCVFVCVTLMLAAPLAPALTERDEAQSTVNSRMRHGQSPRAYQSEWRPLSHCPHPQRPPFTACVRLAEEPWRMDQLYRQSPALLSPPVPNCPSFSCSLVPSLSPRGKLGISSLVFVQVQCVCQWYRESRQGL